MEPNFKCRKCSAPYDKKPAKCSSCEGKRFKRSSDKLWNDLITIGFFVIVVTVAVLLLIFNRDLRALALACLVLAGIWAIVRFLGSIAEAVPIAGHAFMTFFFACLTCGGLTILIWGLIANISQAKIGAAITFGVVGLAITVVGALLFTGHLLRFLVTIRDKQEVETERTEHESDGSFLSDVNALWSRHKAVALTVFCLVILLIVGSGVFYFYWNHKKTVDKKNTQRAQLSNILTSEQEMLSRVKYQDAYYDPYDETDYPKTYTIPLTASDRQIISSYEGQLYGIFPDFENLTVEGEDYNSIVDRSAQFLSTATSHLKQLSEVVDADYLVTADEMTSDGDDIEMALTDTNDALELAKTEMGKLPNH